MVGRGRSWARCIGRERDEVSKSGKVRSGLAYASLWLGLVALALALPPTLIIFFVPGFWIDWLNLTSAASPVVAFAGLAAGLAGRGGARRAQARAGIALSLLTVVLLAAQVVRVWLVRAGG
jgi:hypothetical protein